MTKIFAFFLFLTKDNSFPVQFLENPNLQSNLKYFRFKISQSHLNNNIKLKFWIEMDLKCSAKQTFIGRELHIKFSFRAYWNFLEKYFLIHGDILITSYLSFDQRSLVQGVLIIHRFIIHRFTIHRFLECSNFLYFT